MIRQADFAGSFYPSARGDLEAQIEKCVDADAERESAIGVISPHAGYVYSGLVAGALWSRVELPDTVVILAPNHHGAGRRLALWPEGEWATPLGNAAIDQDLTDAIAEACPLVDRDPVAHRGEHSAEVQVPFLQYFKPDVQLASIVIAERQLAPLKELGAALAGVIERSAKRVLVLASSDMSHFETQATANQLDRMALEQVEAMDEDGLWRVVHERRISMCGVSPTIAMLACAKKLGAAEAEIVKYQTSGDVTGDMSRVVGYAAVIVR